jgi:hypothetical protein
VSYCVLCGKYSHTGVSDLVTLVVNGESIDGEEAIDRKHVEEKLSEIPNKELRETLAKALDPNPAKRPSSEELTDN